MTDSENLVARIKASMKEAMRAREKERLATIRLIQAEFKRVEVDERIERLRAWIRWSSSVVIPVASVRAQAVTN